MKGRVIERETAYDITSLSRKRANAKQLLDRVRDHWGAIENGLHDVRDEAFGEGRGTIARSRRVVDRMQAFLGDEVYHYHHKLILKEPHGGGAWEWHQDYGVPLPAKHRPIRSC